MPSGIYLLPLSSPLCWFSSFHQLLLEDTYCLLAQNFLHGLCVELALFDHHISSALWKRSPKSGTSGRVSSALSGTARSPAAPSPRSGFGQTGQAGTRHSTPLHLLLAHLPATHTAGPQVGRGAGMGDVGINQQKSVKTCFSKEGSGSPIPWVINH